MITLPIMIGLIGLIGGLIILSSMKANAVVRARGVDRAGCVGVRRGGVIRR